MNEKNDDGTNIAKEFFLTTEGNLIEITILADETEIVKVEFKKIKYNVKFKQFGIQNAREIMLLGKNGKQYSYDVYTKEFEQKSMLKEFLGSFRNSNEEYEKYIGVYNSNTMTGPNGIPWIELLSGVYGDGNISEEDLEEWEKVGNMFSQIIVYAQLEYMEKIKTYGTANIGFISAFYIVDEIKKIEDNFEDIEGFNESILSLENIMEKIANGNQLDESEQQFYKDIVREAIISLKRMVDTDIYLTKNEKENIKTCLSDIDDMEELNFFFDEQEDLIFRSNTAIEKGRANYVNNIPNQILLYLFEHEGKIYENRGKGFYKAAQMSSRDKFYINLYNALNQIKYEGKDLNYFLDKNKTIKKIHLIPNYNGLAAISLFIEFNDGNVFLYSEK